jgi:hypothetical protein
VIILFPGTFPIFVFNFIYINPAFNAKIGLNSGQAQLKLIHNLPFHREIPSYYYKLVLQEILGNCFGIPGLFFNIFPGRLRIFNNNTT